VETVDTLETLRRLQDVDRRLRHIRRMKQYEPQRLAEAEEKKAAAEKLRDELHQDHGDIQRKLHKAELDVKSREEKIRRLKSQMLEASTNREYQSFLNEVSLQEVEKDRAEERVLELMEEIEGFDEREATVKREIDEADSELAATRAEVEKALEELGEKEKELSAEREEIASALERDTLRRYEALFASRDGEAVVRAQYRVGEGRSECQYICTGCYMRLNPQMVNLLLIGRELVQCKSCGRILYIDESEEQSE